MRGRRRSTALAGIIGFALAAVGAAPNPGRSAVEATYVVDPARSTVLIHVGRAGLFGFAGHEHLVVAPQFDGEIRADSGDLARCSVEIGFDAAALEVASNNEPPGDPPKVRERMVGPDVLNVAHFPRVTFRSTAVEGRPSAAGVFHLSVTGALGLHGMTRTFVVPVDVSVSADTLTARGSFVLKQTDYGIAPVSVAGVVKVKNEVSVSFAIVASSKAR